MAGWNSKPPDSRSWTLPTAAPSGSVASANPSSSAVPKPVADMSCPHSAIPAGGGATEHVHGVEAEAFYVLRGHLRYAWEGETLDVGPGSFLHLEPGLAYSFRVTGSDPAELLIIYAPAGLEHFIADVGVADSHDEAVSRQAAERSLQDLEAMKVSAGTYGLTYTKTIPA